MGTLTPEQIEKIGFYEFISRTAETSGTGGYSNAKSGDEAQALLGAIRPILASKNLSYRRYFEMRPSDFRKFLRLCGVLERDPDEYQSGSSSRRSR